MLMYEIIDTIWGHSFDGSLCGIVIVENNMGERRAFIGSKGHGDYDIGDAEYIARWGNELTARELLRLVSILEKLKDFESREEAEKAVEKLRAFKRLKDKGFRFNGYSHYDCNGNESPSIGFEYSDFDKMFDDKQVVADLDLLFRGEE